MLQATSASTRFHFPKLGPSNENEVLCTLGFHVNSFADATEKRNYGSDFVLGAEWDPGAESDQRCPIFWFMEFRVACCEAFSLTFHTSTLLHCCWILKWERQAKDRAVESDYAVVGDQTRRLETNLRSSQNGEPSPRHRGRGIGKRTQVLA
jgi:hypothetical protein